MEQRNESQLAEWTDERLALLGPDGAWQPDLEQGLAALFRHRDRSKRRRTALFVGVVAALGGAALVALPAPRAFAQKVCDSCIALWQTITVPPPGTPRIDAEVIRPAAPDFSRPDSSGAPVRLSDFRGRVVLLSFWATWCPPCRMEAPWFVEFQKAYAVRGFSAIGISFDDGWNPVTAFVAENGINYPMVMGDDALAASFGGIRQLPATLILDRSGRIAVMHAGLVSKSQIQGEIEALLAEK